MPILNRSKNCVLCASPHHAASLCPRNGGSAAEAAAPALQATVPKAAAAKPKSAAAKAKSDAAKAKFDAAKARADAAKARADAKRAADRADRLQLKQFKDQQQLVYCAAYTAMTGVGLTIPATPGNYAHSRWALVADVCVHCERPSKGCMCV